MPRYIDAEKLKERLLAISVVSDDLYGMGINRGLDRAETAIDMLPTADVVPKSEVVREIFEKIEKHLARFSHIHRYAEEAEKVTEEYADGSPVEMTSVWDACKLEHNGYDDYETMCKLQENIGNIAMSRLLKELEGNLAVFKKEYTEG